MVEAEELTETDKLESAWEKDKGPSWEVKLLLPLNYSPGLSSLPGEIISDSAKCVSYSHS